MTQFLNSETPRPSYISYGSFDKTKWDFKGGDDNKAYLMPKINWSVEIELLMVTFYQKKLKFS